MNGTYRGPSTQQGYSPFSTWTRGLAWAMLGYAEELEFFKTIPDAAFKASTGLAKTAVVKPFELAAKALEASTDDRPLGEDLAQAADLLPHLGAL